MGEAKRRKALGMATKTMPISEFAIEMYRRYGKGVVSYPGRESGIPAGYFLESFVRSMEGVRDHQEILLSMLQVYNPETQIILAAPMNEADPCGPAYNLLVPLDSQFATMKVCRDILNHEDIVVHR